MQHQLPQLLFVIRGEQQALAQENQLLAQLVLELGTMQMHGNLKPAENIGAEQDAMPVLHVKKFDGENVGGTLQFFASQNQRLMMFLLCPPCYGGRNCGERRKRTLA